MGRLAGAWGVLLVVGGLSSGAEAQTAAVLGLQSLEGDDDFAAELTVALREEATHTLDWTFSGEEVSLAQVLLVERCSMASDRCLSRAGQALDVDLLVFGMVRRSAPGRRYDFEVTLSVFDVNAETVVGTTSGEIERGRGVPQNLRASAIEYLGALGDQISLEHGAPGTETDHPGPLESQEPETDDVDNGIPNWLVWTLMSAAVVAGAVQTVAWVRANRAGDTLVSLPDAEPVRRLQQTMPDQGGHACNFAEVPADVEEICDDASTWSTVTYVTLPLTILLTAAAVSLLVVDATDVLSEGSDDMELSLSPWVGPRQGGGQATLRF